MPTWLLLLVMFLSTHRLTRLVTRDEFPPSKMLRARVEERWGEGSWQSYLSECDWCASMYVGGVITLVTALTIGVPAPVLVWFAASSVTGLIAQREPD